MKYGLVLAFVIAAISGCKEKESKPVDPAAWVKEHGAEVNAVRAKLDAAAGLVKDLPAASAHVADPTPPFVLQQQPFKTDANASLLRGQSLRGMPEYQRESEIGGPVYLPAVELDLLYALVDTGKLVKPYSELGLQTSLDELKRLRYVIITHELSYEPGTLDLATKTFTPGHYSGVAHLVDLEGPKLLGSVAYSATNTGKFESHEGNEKLSLAYDLRQALNANFRGEWGKVFPKIVLPPDPM
jgi:hypothetical protein